MPDDLNAYDRLAAATKQLRHVLGHVKGLGTWGDALPHHPAQTAGMSDAEIESLARRPARLPVEQLTLDECDYFFSHASYGKEGGSDLRHAVRYFLPLYANDVLANLMTSGLLDCLTSFGNVLRSSSWWAWPKVEAEMSAWLAAWLNTAARFSRPLPSCGYGILYPCSSGDEGTREFREVIEAVLLAGLGAGEVATELATWDLPIAIQAIACLVDRDVQGVTKLRLPEARWVAGWAQPERILASGEVVRQWLLSDSLRRTIEQAVLDNHLPELASAALTSLELLKQASKESDSGE